MAGQHVDFVFDLDEALTAVDSTADISRAASLVSKMPTAVTGAGSCIVCREGFGEDEGDGKQLPCGHLYHASCIISWLSLRNSCPLCRSSVSP